MVRIGSSRLTHDGKEHCTERETTIGGIPTWGDVSDFFGHADDCDKDTEADLDERREQNKVLMYQKQNRNRNVLPLADGW